jgi:hypothetical protein
MSKDTANDRVATIVVAEDGDGMILGVRVPLIGPFTKNDRQAARVLFELVLDIRSSMKDN